MKLGEVFRLVGLFEVVDVVVSVFLANEGDRVAVLDEDHVHQSRAMRPLPSSKGWIRTKR